MGVIIPAVLVPSRKALDDTLSRLKGLVDVVQVDIVDGRFVGPPTWPYSEAEELGILRGASQFPHLGEFKFEVDLMVENPEDQIGPWIDAGVERILVHIESVRNMERVVETMKGYGHEKGFAPDLLSLGIAINIDTDTAAIEPYLDDADYVQFMGIKTIGKQGQPFDERVLRKIEAFRKAHPGMPVQVDGAVSEKTAPALLAAGVDRLCIGSALLKAPDIEAALHRFEGLAEEYGRYS